MQLNFENYEKIINATELFYTFRENFFELLNNNIADKEAVLVLKQYFNDYQFEDVRLLLDKNVEHWQNKALASIQAGISDRVYNTAYRNYKEVEDTFMYFYEKYYDIIELNIG